MAGETSRCNAGNVRKLPSRGVLSARNASKISRRAWRPTMNFFEISSQVGGSHETDASKVKPNRGDADRCPKCGGFITMLKWLPPFRVELEVFGKALGDVAFGTGDDLILSERFLEAWTREGLKGLHDVTPVEIVRVKPKRFAA